MFLLSFYSHKLQKFLSSRGKYIFLWNNKSIKVITAILIPLISHASQGQSDCSNNKYLLITFWEKIHQSLLKICKWVQLEMRAGNTVYCLRLESNILRYFHFPVSNQQYSSGCSFIVNFTFFWSTTLQIFRGQRPKSSEDMPPHLSAIFLSDGGDCEYVVQHFFLFIQQLVLFNPRCANTTPAGAMWCLRGLLH